MENLLFPKCPSFPFLILTGKILMLNPKLALRSEKNFRLKTRILYIVLDNTILFYTWILQRRYIACSFHFLGHRSISIITSEFSV